MLAPFPRRAVLASGGRPLHHATELATAELDALHSVGAFKDDVVVGADHDPLIGSQAQYMALLEESLSAAEAAKLLRVDVSRVRQRPAGTPLARIYFSAGPYPSHWNRFRHVGPSTARWDHHLPSSSDEPTEQGRAVLYCAPQMDTCAAEVFRQPAGLTGSATRLPSSPLPCTHP